MSKRSGIHSGKHQREFALNKLEACWDCACLPPNLALYAASGDGTQVISLARRVSLLQFSMHRVPPQALARPALPLQGSRPKRGLPGSRVRTGTTAAPSSHLLSVVVHQPRENVSTPSLNVIFVFILCAVQAFVNSEVCVRKACIVCPWGCSLIIYMNYYTRIRHGLQMRGIKTRRE